MAPALLVNIGLEWKGFPETGVLALLPEKKSFIILTKNWLVTTIENWAEQFLMAHPNHKVRSSAAYLIVSLVPSPHFRQAFRSARAVPNPLRETLLSREETETLHQILEFLFSLLPNARQYTDLQQHGSAKLVSLL